MSHSSVEVSPTKLLLGKIAIPVAFCALVLILFLPLQGLSPAGQAMLGILALAVILWVTEAMAYPISALLIALLMTLFLGLIPNIDTGSAIGTSKAILQAMKGFSSPSIIVISGALIMAAAMQATELDRRIARAILSRVHPSPSAILAGCLLVGVVFSFLIPSPTGRTAVQIPILAGVVATLGLGEKSRFAAILVIGAAQVSTIWNVGVMTATGHNVAGLELMAEHSGFTITWAKWLLHAGPWSAFMTVILFLILRRELKGVNFNSDVETLTNNKEPLNKQQKRLGLFTVALITSWITEGTLHHITVPATMLIMAVCLLLPGIGVFDSWKDVESSNHLGTQPNNDGVYQTTSYRCAQPQKYGFTYLVAITCTMIKTDDRLTSLSNAHHGKQGKYTDIGGQTVGHYMAFTELFQQHEIKQHHGHG